MNNEVNLGGVGEGQTTEWDDLKKQEFNGGEVGSEQKAELVEAKVTYEKIKNNDKVKKVFAAVALAAAIAAGVAGGMRGGNSEPREYAVETENETETETEVEAIKYDRHPIIMLEDGTSLDAEFTSEELSSPESFKEVMDVILGDDLVKADMKDTFDQHEQGSFRSTVIGRHVDDGAKGRLVCVDGEVMMMSDKGFKLAGSDEKFDTEAHIENMNRVHGPGVELSNGQMAWTNGGDNKRWAGIEDDGGESGTSRNDDEIKLKPAPTQVPDLPIVESPDVLPKEPYDTPYAEQWVNEQQPRSEQSLNRNDKPASDYVEKGGDFSGSDLY